MNLTERLYRFRSFWIFPLVGIALIDLASRAEPQRRLGDLLWLLVLGGFIWTLLEYVLHRFLFHIQISPGRPRLRSMVNGYHLEHHASPRDPNKVLVQPVFGLVFSAFLYALLYALSRSLFSAAGLVAGIWMGFLYYEAVHYRAHFSLSPSGLIAHQRRAHFYHHFTNNRRRFGVTSPIWDYVFGTASLK